MNFEEQKEQLKTKGVKFKTKTVTHQTTVDTRLYVTLSENVLNEMEETKINNVLNYNLYNIIQEYNPKSFMIFPKIEIEEISKIVRKKYTLKIIIILK